MEKKEVYMEPVVEIIKVDDVIVASGIDPGPGGDDSGQFQI